MIPDLKDTYVILIVDDQSANIKLLSTMLTRFGYQQLTATNGQEAVDTALSQPVDLILMDIMMPVMDGIEAARILRSHETTQAIPIIFISALSDITEKVRAFDSGAVDYLTRPFDVHELQSRIKTQLELQEHRRHIHSLLQEKTNAIVRLEHEVLRRRATEHELSTANKRLTIINHLTSLTHLHLDSAHVLEATCQQLVSALGSSCGFVLRLMDDPTHVRVDAVFPSAIEHPMLAQKALPPLMTVAYLQSLTYPQVLNDASADEVFAPMMAKISDVPYQRLLLHTVTLKGIIFAVIGVCRTTSQDFDTEDTATVYEVCHVAAQALDNSLLHEQLATRNQRLNNLVNERTQQLNRLNQRTNAILANVTDAIVVLDTRGEIDITNSGFDRLFAYEPDALFGQPVTVLTTPADAVLLSQAVHSVQPQQPQRLQLVMYRQDGSTFDADVAVAIIKNRSDDPQYVVMCHDVSSFKELERLKDGFISTITHELRTPIAGIQLIANQLYRYDDRMETPVRLRKLEQLIVQSNVMAELIESVLDISRLENRRLKNYAVELVDMASLLLAIVEQQQPVSSSRYQTLTIEIDDDIPLVAGDNDELERVWRNLVSNAIKYTPEGGTINVRLGWSFRDDTFQVSRAFQMRQPTLAPLLPFAECIIGEVSDSGHGMDETQLANLFTRFYRGWARQSKIPGTGLGLALVKELITAYDGGIHVESRLGEGTTFIFWLPITPNKGRQS